MTKRSLGCLLILLCFAPVTWATQPGSATIERRVLFDFSQANAASRWRIVNDGVMGGRSTSRAVRTVENQLRFTGNLSLANSGGFASVRSRSAPLGLRSGDVIVLLVRGDGRKYTFNLYVPTRRTAFSYRVEFKTEPNKWMEFRFPLNRFYATSFGRPMRGVSLNPASVDSVGILLGDKKPGRFEIFVDRIEVESSGQ